MTRDPDVIYGPVGSYVFCAYWQRVHRVVAHVQHGDWRGLSVVVEDVNEHPLSASQWKRDANGTREHCTPLERRDRIIAFPVGYGRS